MSKLSSLTSRPMLVVTSEDAYSRGDQGFAGALRRAGNSRVSTLHLTTDHAYSDQRGPLSGAAFSAGSRPSLLRQRAELPGGSVRMVVVTVVMMVVGLRKRRRGEQRDQGEQECLFHSTIISPKQQTATPLKLLFWVEIGFQNGTPR